MKGLAHSSSPLVYLKPTTSMQCPGKSGAEVSHLLHSIHLKHYKFGISIFLWGTMPAKFGEVRWKFYWKRGNAFSNSLTRSVVGERQQIRWRLCRSRGAACCSVCPWGTTAMSGLSTTHWGLSLLLKNMVSSKPGLCRQETRSSKTQIWKGKH